jgi:tRNA modification GTPase
MTEGDTISAVSTPPGKGGIGIIRLSGPEAVTIAERVFVSPRGRRPSAAASHSVLYGHVMDPDTGEAVDEVLLTVMRAPNTYTREDVVEINCHGGMVPLRRVLELTIRMGARLAGAGEFTRRAFLNGRIDLSQAEAALDLIRAKTAQAEKMALGQLRGALSRKINALRERLLGACAHVEACIDFPEEEIEPSSAEEIRGAVGECLEEISALSKSFEEGRFFREGLKAVIAGRPNVGKSSLLNALLERDRAIVTEMPGTTRDVIEEYININGLPLAIMDTAGITQARDMAEAEGVRRTLRAMEEADLIIGVLDGSEPLRDGDAELLGALRGRNCIVVINKADLPGAQPSYSGGLPAFSVSAKSGQGLRQLKEGIFASCIKRGLPGETVMVTNLRHKAALDAAGGRLEAALAAMAEARPLEITALELREALDSLGTIVGAVTTEEILQRIFSEFCIGK